MKKIAIYTRQSIDKKDSISVETQFDSCKLRLTDEELKQVEKYSDKGYSGKNTNRPEIQKLISDIEDNKIEKVLVYKLDRISRNITDFYKLYETMEEHSCEFCSATENFDTSTSMGKAMMGILAVFAQMERENIQKRVKDNYYDRTERLGSWPGGPAPYGFKNSKTEDRRPTLITNENEKTAVEFLFDSYANDLNTSLGTLAKKLYVKGYRSHKRKGGMFDNVTIARILKNTVYVKADEVLYNYLRGEGIKIESPVEKWDGSHSAHIINKKPYKKSHGQRIYTDTNEQIAYITNFCGFIDSKTYIKVQKRLKDNRQIGRANGHSKLEEFAGKLKCGNCGYAIKIYNGQQLSCYGNISLHVCNARFNRRGYIDELRLNDIRDRVAPEISQYYSILRFSYNQQFENNKETVKERDGLQEQIDNLTDSLSMTKDSDVKKAILEKISTLSKKKSELELKISDFESIDINDFKENIDYYSLSSEKRKAIINKLIDKIIVTDISVEDQIGEMPYKVEIVWKNEISEEYRKLYKETTKNFSEEDFQKLFVESYSCIPYEDYCEISQYAKSLWDKYSKYNIKLDDSFEYIETYKHIGKDKLGLGKSFGCLAYYTKTDNKFVITKFKTCFKNSSGKHFYIKDLTYKVENLNFESKYELQNYVNTIASNMSEELKKKPELIPDI